MNLNWLPVIGFEDVYEVSRHGEIRRIGNLQYRKIQITNRGYGWVMWGLGFLSGMMFGWIFMGILWIII